MLTPLRHLPNLLQLLLILLPLGLRAEPNTLLALTPLEPHPPHHAVLALELEQPAPVPRLLVLQQPPRLLIDLPQTTGNPELPEPPHLPHEITAIEVAQSANTTRIVLDLQAPPLPTIIQQENRLLIQLQPPPENPIEPGEISLALDEQPLSVVLQQLGESAGVNLIVDGEINATTSLRLQRVNWREAFNLLVAQHSLQVIEQDGIVLVTPGTTADSGESADPAPVVATPKLQTEMFTLRYADATELKKTLESSSQSNPLLSSRGVLGLDVRTNTLLIQDEPHRLESIREVIQQLDIPSRQVLIESRIIIASNDFSHELGTRLGVTSLRSEGEQWSYTAPNELNTPGGVSGNVGKLLVNLPISNPLGSVGLALAKLSSDILIDLELSAAEREGKSETVANPRIITSDGYEASIQQGVEIPYRSDTAGGGTDVSFKEAVMELRVTPQITPERQIILTLQVKKDAVGATFCNNCEPSVDTREIRTRVMIGDGETLVIGGIYEESDRAIDNRIPVIAELPIIGRLFSQENRNRGKDELLIFITPSIIEG